MPCIVSIATESMHSCVVRCIVILNTGVVAGNPFHLKCSMLIHSFGRSFIFIFVSIRFIYLFVCLMSVRMKNTLIKTTETFNVCLFLKNLLYIVVFGSNVLSHTQIQTHTRMYIMHTFVVFSLVFCYGKSLSNVDTFNRQKKNANHIPPVKLTV